MPVGAQVADGPVELSGLDPSQNSAWSYRASINLTVFDGLLTKSNIRRAEANLLSSRRELESTRRDVLFGVRQAYLDLEIARQSIEVDLTAARLESHIHSLPS